MAGKLDNIRFRKLLLTYPAKAIELLYGSYYNNLVRMAIKYTRDDEAAEDIVQEVFLYIWTNSKRLGQPNEQSIEHYLVRAVRNKAISHYKEKVKISMEKAKWKSDNLLIQFVSTSEANLIEKELIHEIRQMIETFPAKERLSLLMRIDQEMTVEQIAEIQKVTRKAVERSLTSAYKRLRKYWKSRLK
jgi:RNA polymerase sigma-70 factor (ECF subfamily)